MSFANKDDNADDNLAEVEEDPVALLTSVSQLARIGIITSTKALKILILIQLSPEMIASRTNGCSVPSKGITNLKTCLAELIVNDGGRRLPLLPLLLLLLLFVWIVADETFR